MKPASIHTFHNVWSPQLRNRRDVDIYLPASYPDGRHPVVYMQDGQNLADPSIAFADTWLLESVLVELAAAGIEPIVVGVHNHRERLAEYSPYPSRTHGGGRADAYLSFLIRTLKPRIDRQFRTRRLSSATAIVGSSMGGLLSLYAWFRHPDVFGLAGAMSPALWFGREQLLEFVRQAPLPQGRLYLDVGTSEGASTVRDARTMSSLIEARTVSSQTTFMYLEDRGGGHSESAWSRRLTGALEFLLQR